MRVLITGSRVWDDVDIVLKVLQKLPKDTVIIHGDAIGADTIADVVAKELGLKTEPCPPSNEEIRIFGPHGAPLARNRRMVQTMGAELVIGFRDVRSKSGGTAYTMEIARGYGIKVLEISNQPE